VLLARGFDVSEYSGPNVSFQAFADDEYSFVFLRASIGTHKTDAFFGQNVKKARDAGLVVGTYAAFFANLDPQVQAQFYFHICDEEGLGQSSDMVVPCSDFELLHNTPIEFATEKAYEFQKTIEDLWNLEAGNSFVYSYPYFIDQWPDGSAKAALGLRRLAIANYGVSKPRIPAPFMKWDDWQHAGDVVVHGSMVDLDCYNGCKEDLPLCSSTKEEAS
jgi:GH25 family lysozyme M1 (1,4-beta-N-acetylmuramidase)